MRAISISTTDRMEGVIRMLSLRSNERAQGTCVYVNRRQKLSTCPSKTSLHLQHRREISAESTVSFMLSRDFHFVLKA